MGRPTEYTKEIGDEICEIIATSNKGLSTICKDERMPCRATIHNWLKTNETFLDNYTRAKQDQADFLVDEMLEIADTCRPGTKKVIKPTGEEVTEGDMIERSKLMVDTRKFIASKLKPKKYGQNIDVTSGGLPVKQTFVVNGKEIEF